MYFAWMLSLAAYHFILIVGTYRAAHLTDQCCPTPNVIFRRLLNLACLVCHRVGNPGRYMRRLERSGGLHASPQVRGFLLGPGQLLGLLRCQCFGTRCALQRRLDLGLGHGSCLLRCLCLLPPYVQCNA